MRANLPAWIMFFAANSVVAEPLVIGDVEIPLGSTAFAQSVLCLHPTVCGAHISYLGPPPLYPFYPWESGLDGTHLLEVVLADLRIAHEVQLDFAGIENQAGPDLYLAQAKFLAGPLGEPDTNTHDFDLRVESGTWTTIATGAFVQDSVLPLLTVYTSDGEIQASAYRLWYARVELSDLGIAPGAVVTRLTLRGPDVPSMPETAGLDVVTVASLNRLPDADADTVPDGDDNCLEEANTDQRDTNGDAIGNACDPDFNGDCFVNFDDLALMEAAFFGSAPDLDIDGNGNVNFADLGTLKAMFFSAPGPSGLPNACAPTD